MIDLIERFLPMCFPANSIRMCFPANSKNSHTKIWPMNQAKKELVTNNILLLDRNV